MEGDCGLDVNDADDTILLLLRTEKSQGSPELAWRNGV